jgi:hypothetical protein
MQAFSKIGGYVSRPKQNPQTKNQLVLPKSGISNTTSQKPGAFERGGVSVICGT